MQHSKLPIFFTNATIYKRAIGSCVTVYRHSAAFSWQKHRHFQLRADHHGALQSSLQRQRDRSAGNLSTSQDRKQLCDVKSIFFSFFLPFWLFPTSENSFMTPSFSIHRLPVCLLLTEVWCNFRSLQMLIQQHLCYQHQHLYIRAAGKASASLT